ncbi:MAG: 8-amino-7-oxononanoate synthase [Candidatus Omnitrophica bacterium]|nr:8-amino-7-oxononanoate synthase [Candidatus Omnitrophota bacterium]
MVKRIADHLKRLEEGSSLRSLTRLSPDKRGEIVVGPKRYVNLSSNDYLGLASHRSLAKAAQEALSPVVSATASRLMTGSTELHHALEERTAIFKQKEAALVFNSGYQANVGIISSILGRGDCVFSDRLNHASIIDGIRLSGARLFRFRHNDPEHLECLLHEHRKEYRDALIVTETVFSMDGDVAPLKHILKLKKAYDCLLMVDEAHATGIFGPGGSGMTEQEGITGDVDIIMGTFSKALAGFGAYAAVSDIMRSYLINTCRSFIYSTALPPAVIASNIAAMEIIEKEPHRRRELLERADYLRKRLRDKGYTVFGRSQIIPLVVKENQRAVMLSDRLRKKGFWVMPVRPPTVPKNSARLRISVTYDHSRDVLDRLVEALSGI